MQQRNKPFAPFGVLLHHLRSQNVPILFTPYIFCGTDAWAEAKRMNSMGTIALCLPPNTLVTTYYWPINGLSLILFDTGGMTQHALDLAVHALLKAGATQVCLYQSDGTGVEIYHL